MSKNDERGYYVFRGNALALGGFITSPDCKNIESVAPVMLPESGGVSSARVSGYRFGDIISVEEATCQVIGVHHRRSGEFNTLVRVDLRGLNILDVVRADAVTARLAAVFRRDPEDPDRPPEINPLGSHFVNLRIAGRLFDPDLIGQGAGDETSGYDEVRKYILKKREQSRGKRRRTYLARHELLRKGEIEIPQFGSIAIAEWLDDPYVPRLTMIRVRFGCAIEGETSCGVVEGGGSDWPP